MTEAPQTSDLPASDTATAAGDPQLSHLSQLHRMSRTAGLGSSDYTAVNTASVVAVLIGAASALALMTPVFLLLSVVGLVVAIMAIVQVRRSNRTQTGLGLAILGLALCFTFSVWTAYKSYKLQEERDRDIATLNSLDNEFGQDLAKQKYADAYALTDDRFHEEVSAARFEALFAEIASSPQVGSITGCRSNGLFGIDSDPETDMRTAVGITLIDTTRRNGEAALRTEFRFRNNTGKWLIYAIPEWFAPPKPAPGAGAAGSPGSGGAGSAPTGPAGPPMPK